MHGPRRKLLSRSEILLSVATVQLGALGEGHLLERFSRGGLHPSSKLRASLDYTPLNPRISGSPTGPQGAVEVSLLPGVGGLTPTP